MPRLGQPVEPSHAERSSHGGATSTTALNAEPNICADQFAEIDALPDRIAATAPRNVLRGLVAG